MTSEEPEFDWIDNTDECEDEIVGDSGEAFEELRSDERDEWDNAIGNEILFTCAHDADEDKYF